MKNRSTGYPASKENYSSGESKIREAMRKRNETDRLMSPLWVLSPLAAGVILSVILFLVIGGSAFFFGGSILSGIPAIIAIIAALTFYIFLIAYPWYLMIKRRTEHFKRDHILMSGIIEYLQEKQADSDVNLTQEMATLRSISSEAYSEESEKSPILYTILALVIPYIGILYVLYFLMKDVYEHHQRISVFMQNTQWASNKLDESIVVPSWKTLPNRSFVVYLIISCICGPFMYYWMYTIIKDYNEHFKNQWRFEDQILDRGSASNRGYMGPGPGAGSAPQRQPQQYSNQYQRSGQQRVNRQQQQPSQQQSSQSYQPSRSQPSSGKGQSFEKTQKKPSKKSNLCPDCNTEMRYIEKYDRWYCDRCEQYK